MKPRCLFGRKEMIDDAVRFFLSEPRYAILMDILNWR